MIIESTNKYTIHIPFEYFNEFGILKPQGYQSVINLLTEYHLDGTEQAFGNLIVGKYSWVIVSLALELEKPLKDINTVYGKTWYSGRKGPFFRREYEIYDQNNNILFKGASYSILMDLENRSIYRKVELPFKVFKITNKLLVEANHNLKIDNANNKILDGTIYNSHIDLIGHVNNISYTEFVYNSFNEQEVLNLENIKRFEFYFHKEMTKGDTFSIYKNDFNEFQIINNNTKQKSFSFVVKEVNK